jgi:hypothetical protein
MLKRSLVLAQAHETLAADAHLLPEAAEILVQEVVGEGIVPGRARGCGW